MISTLFKFVADFFTVHQVQPHQHAELLELYFSRAIPTRETKTLNLLDDSSCVWQHQNFDRF